MAVPIDMDGLCVSVTRTRQLCVTFPGGVQVCAQVGIDKGDTGEVVRGFFASLNSSLAPLQPFLNLLDVVLAIVECVKAIPDALGVPPDPSKIVQCIPELVDAVAKVAGLPLQIPVMIKQIVQVLVEGILVVLGELEAFIVYEADLLDAATTAAEPGNEVLLAIVDCEQANFAAELGNVSESMKPLNRLIAIVNLVLSSLIGQELPTFGDLGGSAAEAIDAIKPVLEVITTILSYLPG